jgi:hypothetical protein
MAEIEVFRVKIYDGMTDDYIVSRRMATRRGASIMGGEIFGKSVSIDELELEEGHQWTPLDFKPKTKPQDPPDGG